MPDLIKQILQRRRMREQRRGLVCKKVLLKRPFHISHLKNMVMVSNETKATTEVLHCGNRSKGKESFNFAS